MQVDLKACSGHNFNCVPQNKTYLYILIYGGEKVQFLMIVFN